MSRCYDQRETAPFALFVAQPKDFSNSASFLFFLSPCTGGALWPPRIEKAPNDAQEGVATEGRPYGVFYRA